MKINKAGHISSCTVADRQTICDGGGTPNWNAPAGCWDV